MYIIYIKFNKEKLIGINNGYEILILNIICIFYIY